MRRIVLLAISIAGCGSAPPDPDTARAIDVELATRAINRAFGAATLWVSQGVIVTAADPMTIATALSQRVTSQSNHCAIPTQTGAMIHVDMTAGCTLASADSLYTGTIDATVSKLASGDVLVSSTIDLFVDGGSELTGMFTVDTPDGAMYTYGAQLNFGAVQVTTPFLRAGIADFGAAVDSMGMLTGGSGMYTINGMAVNQRFFGCYPFDGQFELTGGGVDEFWNFTSTTPQDGAITPRQPSVPNLIGSIIFSRCGRNRPAGGPRRRARWSRPR